MADQVHIRLLGGFAVAVGDRPVAAGAWRLRKARSLLKLLCLAPGHRMHRERLYDLLWPDLDRTAASNNLHQVLHAARRALTSTGTPGDVVPLRDDVVLLGPDGGVRLDVDELDEAVHRTSRDGTVANYRAALALAEPGLPPEDTYEPWALEAAAALESRRTTLRLGLAEALRREHRTAEAIEVLGGLTAQDPLHEPGHRALMRALADAGRRREALAVYERLRDALRGDTGADPDPDTRRLYRALLADSVEPPRRRPDAPRHNLPAQATGLIGRERESDEVERLLLRSRLLTLTGPGGCGKTRLALAVAARRTGALRDGVWFVDLATLTEPHLVPDAVADVLGIQLPPAGAAREALVGQLRGRELLLVLDNCEHLVDACAALVSDMVARCPGVAVLATSREPLHSYGERTFRVPSLGLPDPLRLPPVEELARFPSVRLFVERAADSAPGFRLTPGNAAAVAQICFRLDGMPLALELAAARVHVLAPRQIAERLDDALALLARGGRHGVTRQETLLATLEWSHRLLDDEEQRLLRRLAVFAGGFSLAAAEEVCADGTAHAPVLDLLGRLADKSLVWVEPRPDETRYRLLETIRQYAAERLRAAGEQAAVEARHRHFYLALAQARDHEPLTGVSGATSLELEADYGNLRAALRSFLRSDPDRALRLAVALRLFWSERGRLAEGRRWLDDTLAAAPRPTPHRARALMAQGVLAVRLGDGSPLQDIGAQIVAIHQRGSDPAAPALAHYQQALLLWMRGTWDSARTALDRARALARDADEPAVLATAAHHEGVWAVCRGDGAAAREACAESLRLLDAAGERTHPYFPVMTPGYAVEETAGQVSLFFEETVLVGRTVGTARARGYVLANLARATRLAGDTGAATVAAERSVDCFRALADPHGESLALNTLGNICRTRGDHDAAAEHLDAALALRRRLGDRREEGITLGCLGLLRLAGGDNDGARAAVACALAGYEETDDIPGAVNSLLHLGLVARAAGDLDEARTLLTRAQRLEHIAGSHCACGWVALMLAQLARRTGDREAAAASAARAAGLFARLGDIRGPAVLRRTAPGVRSGC
ncbi:BTAD domain-containing putative transcriptional regulator [Streptomyces sp. Li-HN-5-11]|uniref:AfsR/SARP family transcriptional regulator n=1 Tax=Streptomyces sp. Li-HN-5-11 TaxID=3075432 RepID=UPI0028AEBED4|nr:BTAD domain-containing putative transcriptional regulator [Streptomyces sp. Li-HN-5-11]WNM32480.1 BTAD domain-containing putative transcriptional regulator [Streptomyces sp. Li-HN-5-11]